MAQKRRTLGQIRVKCLESVQASIMYGETSVPGHIWRIPSSKRCQGSVPTVENGMTSMALTASISTASLPILCFKVAITESMVSPSIILTSASTLAAAGKTLTVSLAFIFVKATVVRTKALSSPPSFLVARFSSGANSFRFAKTSFKPKPAWRPRMSNISRAGPAMWNLKGLFSTAQTALAKTPMGVRGGGEEAWPPLLLTVNLKCSFPFSPVPTRAHFSCTPGTAPWTMAPPSSKTIWGVIPLAAR